MGALGDRCDASCNAYGTWAIRIPDSDCFAKAVLVEFVTILCNAVC